MSRRRSKTSQLGNKLLNFALDGLYYFEDDQVEDCIDKFLIKFQNDSDWEKLIKSSLWGIPEVKKKICDAAIAMWR